MAPAAQKAEIKLLLDGGRSLVMPLTVGQFAPVYQVKGVKGRLKNLGYYHGAVDDASDAESAGAIRAFQNDNALDPTGTLDKATKAKLKGLSAS